ncbi:hypothetical protein [Thioalkalivibrio sp.]|uniref:hypothetical protein n=1 Tax=Thioalkalivibrio sp. TaxID=2093813 RepID=UPI003566A329
MWLKKHIAAFFGVSTTAVDNWIRAGCPAEYDSRDRVKGMLLGEVMEWGRNHPHPDVRRRFREAGYREMMLIGGRMIFLPRDRYLEVLRGRGLSAEDAESALADMGRIASEALAAAVQAPKDALLP